jgi:hypothetical protein
MKVKSKSKATAKPSLLVCCSCPVMLPIRGGLRWVERDLFERSELSRGRRTPSRIGHPVTQSRQQSRLAFLWLLSLAKQRK